MSRSPSLPAQDASVRLSSRPSTSDLGGPLTLTPEEGPGRNLEGKGSRGEGGCGKNSKVCQGRVVVGGRGATHRSRLSKVDACQTKKKKELAKKTVPASRGHRTPQIYVKGTYVVSLRPDLPFEVALSLRPLSDSRGGRGCETRSVGAPVEVPDERNTQSLTVAVCVRGRACTGDVGGKGGGEGKREKGIEKGGPSLRVGWVCEGLVTFDFYIGHTIVVGRVTSPLSLFATD